MREAYVPPPITTITETSPGAEAVSEAGTPAETGTACDLTGFPRNRSRLNNVDKACLDDLASRLKTDPRSRVVAIGHADSAERDPDALGTRRADAVKVYLVKERGIDETRIEVADRGLHPCRRPRPRADPTGACRSSSCRKAEGSRRLGSFPTGIPRRGGSKPPRLSSFRHVRPMSFFSRGGGWRPGRGFLGGAGPERDGTSPARHVLK